MSTKLFSVLFADDSDVFVTGDNLQVLADTINIELEKLNSWLKLNKLSLNIPKAHLMVFSSKHKKVHNINIEINHQKVEEKKMWYSNHTFKMSVVNLQNVWVYYQR